MTNIQIPEKLGFLFEEFRYKGAKGGRGSAKSHSFASALLVKGRERPTRNLCCREFQKSIKDSVHQLLKDKIQEHGFERFYEVTNTAVRGKNGTLFGFEGLHHNINNIKSWEGADNCWVEEAHVVSKASFDVLIPTIRKPGSEIWLSWNPEFEEDEVEQRFVFGSPPGSKIVTVNWRDNPWFPDVLRKEMEYLKEKDYPAYLHIWEGHYRQAVEGAIFARELQLTADEGRIREVKYDPSVPVDTFWDLGHSDQTAIWFIQVINFEYRVLRCYANTQEKFQHYLKYVQALPYVYGTHYLPHDAAHEHLGQERTIEQQAAAVLGRVEIVPRVHSKANSIEAARAIFPLATFDKENCSDGLSALRRYAYKHDEQTGKISQNPEHNIWSHYADAWQTAGMALKGPVEPVDDLDEMLRKQKQRRSGGKGVNRAWWM